jgi:hydrogenase maturation protease
MSASVLVAGIGNIFLSDDGFGVEVVSRLMHEDLPDDVRVDDFGIRGVHLAYELLENYDAAVIVDAVDMREPPGTIVLIEPERDRDDSGERTEAFDAHTMSPDVVLATLTRLGGSVDRILVLGCQPECLDEGIGLSAPVERAVDSAVRLCSQVVAQLVRPVGKELRT